MVIIFSSVVQFGYLTKSCNILVVITVWLNKIVFTNFSAPKATSIFLQQSQSELTNIYSEEVVTLTKYFITFMLREKNLSKFPWNIFDNHIIKDIIGLLCEKI